MGKTFQNLGERFGILRQDSPSEIALLSWVLTFTLQKRDQVAPLKQRMLPQTASHSDFIWRFVALHKVEMTPT